MNIHKVKDDVLRFWFIETPDDMRFKKSDELDEAIKSRFETPLKQLLEAGHEAMLQDAQTALAGIIILDQFTRNMFRDDPRAFENDWRALSVAQHMVAQGWDQMVAPERQLFVYLPLMHAEDAQAQSQCVELVRKIGNDYVLDFAIQHHVIIDRFGRFPHRNKVLGRMSTKEELEFLKAHTGF